ncbi:uncharacterized protein NDAI_0C01900 [Naumovozyma dairenensis CBS 421]|uniref:Abscisic acid G-protein coupled receptor-like domain-containing protein n=1 Tax=Naumovozyma dairenensis (strain ATCC 10597 / BCRC 20456 / CBS 421 / NBRC 0211 / NRRL Y-12639) TaxID=1071378 RepID=G0W7T9_NAUDC|nr:hypothetical protein NDAI_0C01900 [Naumovozyma dairenensis CBS 421]CCD23850.1 hypothetical protein NDAI_0C01900 [Naumovozyma dairenensis CBS 421]
MYRTSNKTLVHNGAADSNTFLEKFYTEYCFSSNKIVKYIRVIFSLAIVCYVLTVEIVLWQIKAATIENSSADFVTNFLWPMVSASLALVLILCQPFLILLSLLNKFFNDRFDIDRLVIITTSIMLFLILILVFIDVGPFHYTRNILTKLSIAGVTLMAILSGIATVTTTYYTFLYVWRKYVIRNKNKSTLVPSVDDRINQRFVIWATDEDIKEKLKIYLYSINENIGRIELLKNQTAIPTTNFERTQLMELVGYYQLEVGSLEALLRKPRNIRLLRQIFEVGFIIYCVYKILNTFLLRIPYMITRRITNPLDPMSADYYDQKGSSDPLAVTFANILDIFLFRFNYQHDLDSLTRQISLLLSTSLFICSLSTVNMTISYLLELLPIRLQVLAMFAMQDNETVNELPTYKSKLVHKAPSIIKNLIVSELTGIYVIATTLMVRSNLPFDVSTKLRELLGEKFTVPNVAIDDWFDEIFATSCVLTACFIIFVEKTLKSVK